MSEPAVTVALVTGAAGGVGRQVAADLASRGWIVLVPGRSVDVARSLAADLAGFGDVRALEVDLDVTVPAAVEAVPEAVRAATGRLDVLVNNTAAFASWNELASSAGVAAARIVMESNDFGPWRLAQILLPLLRESPHPRIVNVSSGGGSCSDAPTRPTPRRGTAAGHGVSRAALSALTATLAAELAGSNVLVNAVEPGHTATWPGTQQVGAPWVLEVAASVVLAAVLPDGGPSGAFPRDDGELLPW